ncbi:PDK repeat-containing protein [Singulisphaera acidiphila DSM 18658]|uniref:PDK repeat-containing protein n=2 Tax=Singulisphaera acidiphila TaxID=466153 RepID=L0DDN1_SINAD|nr:PDK repeat-containing protein [Singulisphaera acidiphila DSM 18658]
MKPSWRSFLQTRKSKDQRASRVKLRLRVEALEERQLLATGVGSYSFNLGTISSSVASKATNVAPTAQAGGPYSGTAGQALTFKGSATDPNPGDAAAGFTYTWNFGDYSPQVSGLGLSNPSHVYATAGTYRVFVTATDRYGATGPVSIATVTIAPASTKPLTASAGVSYTGKEGSAITLKATASGGNGSYTYAWDLSNNGNYTTAGQNVSTTFQDNGTYTVGLRVTDSAGRIALSTATVTVANVAPTAQAGGPYTGTAGQSLTLKGSATDPSPIDTAAGFTYTWDFGDGSAKVSGLGLTNPSHVYATAGTYTVIVTATDKDKATSPGSSAIITIAPPAPPPLIASTGGTYTGNEGSATALKATATGGTGPYTYAWDLSNNGTYTTVGQNVSVTFPDNGTYTVGLRVTDSAGRTALSTTTVTVANVAPTAFAGGPYTGTAGQSLTLKGSATDPSPIDTAAGFTYTWDFGDGSAKVSGLGLTNPSHVYAAAGTYTVIVTATDKDKATSPGSSAIITISPPAPPPLAASAGGTYTGKEGSATALKATATGGTGPYTYAWDLSNNGTYTTVGQNVSVTFPDNGTYTVGLRVTDSTGRTALSTATVTVANVAPTAFAGGPYTTPAGQSLTFKGSATDPSSVDTAAGFTYTWSFGDGTANAAGKNLTNPSHVYTTAGTYTATLTVTDKDGAVSSAVTAVVTVTKPGGTTPPTDSALYDKALVKWQSQMIQYGRQAAAELHSATGDAALSATYYDSARVFYQIADYTGDSSWLTAVNDSLRIYRDNYVTPNKGNVPGYFNFTNGLLENYRRTGNTASRDAVLAMASAMYGGDSVPASDTAPWYLSREVAYSLLANVNAETLGGPHRARTDLLANQALGHLDQWTVSKTATYVRPFMVALTCEALIAYQAQTGDSRVLPAIRTALDWIWANCWNASARAFQYTNITAPDGSGGTEAAPDLNLLIAPAFGWLYHQTGDTTYRDRGDAIFAGGVDQAWLVGAKQFNQNYRWSFAYVQWRAEPTLGN